MPIALEYEHNTHTHFAGKMYFVSGGVGRVMDEYGQRAISFRVLPTESERASARARRTRRVIIQEGGGGQTTLWPLNQLYYCATPSVRTLAAAAESQGNRMCLGLFASLAHRRLKPKNQRPIKSPPGAFVLRAPFVRKWPLLPWRRPVFSFITVALTAKRLLCCDDVLGRNFDEAILILGALETLNGCYNQQAHQSFDGKLGWLSLLIKL